MTQAELFLVSWVKGGREVRCGSPRLALRWHKTRIQTGSWLPGHWMALYRKHALMLVWMWSYRGGRKVKHWYLTHAVPDEYGHLEWNFLPEESRNWNDCRNTLKEAMQWTAALAAVCEAFASFSR